MTFLSELFGSAASPGAEAAKASAGIVGAIADVAARWLPGERDRQEFQLEVARLIDQRDARIDASVDARIGAQASIITAELAQGDAYTKRARPTIIYYGLAITAWNYSLVPVIAKLAHIDLPPLDLPDVFWQVWGGVAGLYVLGRTAEKSGGFVDAVKNLSGAKK